MPTLPLDPRDPEAAIAAAAKRCSNWGRWGDDDVLGTLNFLDDAKRREGAALVRRGVSFSLAQSFDMNGPQKGWRRRTNPVHTMLDTGIDAERGNQGFPHGIGGADDVIFMPLQASTQWDGLGHIFDHGNAWNGRRAGDVVTSEGDLVTGIQTATGGSSGRGVLLDVGRAIGEDGELPDGFAITAEHLEATIAAQGPSSAVGRGDLVLVRTGRLARARREGWGDYAGGASPGLSFTTADWLHSTRDRRHRHRHLGFRGAAQRVRRRLPTAAPGRHPAHRPVHRRDVGPRRARRGLRRRRRLRILAVRRTTSGHRRGRRPGRPRRRQIAAVNRPPITTKTFEEISMTAPVITHLRHIDLAVPDFAKQLDFYTNTWGLTSEHTDTGIAFLAAEGSPENYIVRLRESTDKRIDLISFGVAIAGGRRRPGREAGDRRGQAGQRTRA